MTMFKFSRGLLAAAAVLAFTSAAQAQSYGPRNLEELKAETQRRADNNLTPIGGVSSADAKRALAEINSLDMDVWAAAWTKIGDEYMAQAKAAEKSSKEKAHELYEHAWEVYNVGRWPSEKLSAGKQKAYDKALDAFANFGRLSDPPIETVRFPFEGKELVAYIRIPKGVTKPPIVIGMNGLDSRKEEVIAASDNYMKNGVAAVAIDMPGTGQSPILIDIGSERVISATIDYLLTRKDLDASRIVFQGRSWSGYWAAMAAYVEKDRIKGAAVHGVGIHDYYSKEWQEDALDTPEYLFDLFPARAAVYGVKTKEDFLAFGPRLSLVNRGLIDKPSAPMIVVNGAKDTQQPISDLFLMLQHGDPKDAWVNPTGGHMGRDSTWPTGRILAEVVEPWLMKKLGVTAK